MTQSMTKFKQFRRTYQNQYRKKLMQEQETQLAERNPHITHNKTKKHKPTNVARIALERQAIQFNSGAVA